MSRVLTVRPDRPDQVEEAAGEAATAIRGGALAIFPTESVYGLATRPDHPDATARIFEAKGRPRSLSLPVLVESAAQAWEVGRTDERALALAEAFWPGPLTLVLPRMPRSRTWPLGAEASTVAVRVPDHPVTQAILRAAGPVAATSANASGQPPIAHEEGLVAAFGERVDVYVVMDPDVPGPDGVPSTVLDLTRPTGPPRILRAGAVDVEAIRRAGFSIHEGPGGQSVH